MIRKLAIILPLSFLGCHSVNPPLVQVGHWEIKQDNDLKDLGVDSLFITNPKHASQIAIVDKNQELAAVNIFLEKGDSVGVQYLKTNLNEIESIKIYENKTDLPFIKIYKNEQGQWVFAEFEKESDRQPSRFEIIDFK